MARADSGYTLYELGICLAVLGVLAALALPDMGDWLQRQQTLQVQRRYVDAIQLARAAAVTRRRMVTFCRSEDGGSCRGRWEQGAIVFMDLNRDGQVQPRGGDEIILHIPPQRGPGTIRWRVFRNTQYLQFTPLGYTNYQNGNFTFCPADGDPRQARQLVVNASGRLRAAVDSDGDGLREDSRGRPLRCP